MDLSNHVILPREDFIELQTAAWDQPSLSVSDRVGTTLQTTLVFAGLAGAATAVMWGWAKAVDWREERAFQRRNREANSAKQNPTS